MVLAMSSNSIICDRIVLVIGSGGREHAIATSLASSARVAKVLVAPGNGGTASGNASISNVARSDLDVNDFEAVATFCLSNNVSLVMVGPEAPLANGITDVLSAKGIQVFGPSQAAAQIEASKSFSKTLMKEVGVPTAAFAVFNDFEKACSYVKAAPFDVVIKASGLAAGKGVILPSSKEEAITALDDMMVKQRFGEAGAQVVVEERLFGREISVLAFSDGHSLSLLPPAQDHKRLLDGDLGPNTGGMGAVAPAPIASKAVLEAVQTTILRPVIDALRRRGHPYRGVLYAGVMLAEDGTVRCLEYNCRLGDPETQALLPLLRSDLFSIAEACVRGCLDSVPITWSLDRACATIVLAAPGYPAVDYAKGLPITIGELPASTKVFQAGTVLSDKSLLSCGGRVLAVSATADGIEAALDLAYEAVEKVTMERAQFRKDIGASARSSAAKKVEQQSLYAAAGVNIAEGNRAVSLMKSAVEETYGAEVLSGLGSFGGLYDGDVLKSMVSPVLVASSDGVGTKIKLASQLGIYDTIGKDIVNHCVNDILVQGATPLFFLDYVAASRIRPEMVADVVRGAAEACKAVGCALLGGETAEMPGVYCANEFDLAGTIVGVVERGAIIDGSNISVGDAIVALPSSGLHTNGFSLARAIFKDHDMLVKMDELGGRSLREVLLEPHRSYLGEYRKMIGAGVSIHGLAHITGGGLIENPPRILPANAAAELHLAQWTIPPVFQLMQKLGHVPFAEMCQVFNMGLGMLVFVPAEQASIVIDTLGNDNATLVGKVIARGPGGQPVVIRSDEETDHPEQHQNQQL